MKFSEIQRIGECQISESNVVLLYKHLKKFVVRVINQHNGDISFTEELSSIGEARKTFSEIIEFGV